MRRSRYQKWVRNGLHYRRVGREREGGRKILETHVDQTTRFFSLSLLPVNGYYCLLSYCFRVFFSFFLSFLTQYAEKNERTKEHKRNGSKKKKRKRERKWEIERERRGNEVEESERNGWKIKRTTSRISLSLWRGEVNGGERCKKRQKGKRSIRKEGRRGFPAARRR